MFPGLSQKDLFEGKWSLAKSNLNKIIVTLVTQGLPSSFLSQFTIGRDRISLLHSRFYSVVTH